jgi:hypothetical protein
MNESWAEPVALRVTPVTLPECSEPDGDVDPAGETKLLAATVQVWVPMDPPLECTPMRPVRLYWPSLVATVAVPPVAPATLGLRRFTMTVSTRPSVNVTRTATASPPLSGTRVTELMLLTPLPSGSTTLAKRLS